MDIYEYLKLDHAKVDELFKFFEKSKIKKRQEEIMNMIAKELLCHAFSEQETFYKALMNFEETKNLMQHAKKEHQEIEQQIKIINTASPQNYKAAVLKLKDIVKHHVKEEEGEIFDNAKKVLTKKDAYILKEQMHFQKGKYLISFDNKNISAMTGEFKKAKITLPKPNKDAFSGYTLH